MFVRLHEDVGILECAHGEVQENIIPVLRLGLALLKPKEVLQAALLQAITGPHALLCRDKGLNNKFWQEDKSDRKV